MVCARIDLSGMAAAPAEEEKARRVVNVLYLLIAVGVFLPLALFFFFGR